MRWWCLGLGSAAALLAACLSACRTGAPLAVPAAGFDARGVPVVWGIPESELASQRVIKFHYEGPDGDATINLIFRLQDEHRFSLQGNDQIGRSWFRLAVSDGAALLLDLREKTFCRFSETIEIAAIPLGPLPFDELPALLLGRLPLTPTALRPESEGWRFRDRQGRDWTMEADASGLERWTLWQGGEPAVWWSRGSSLFYLSARAEGLQLRWRTPSGQPLTRAPDGLEVPQGYSEGADCR